MSQPVVIRTYDNTFSANVAKTRLEANGIPAILDNAIMSSVWDLPLASFGGVRLLVNPQDVESANNILNDTQPD